MLTGLLLLIVQQNTGKYSKVCRPHVLLFNNLLIKITTFIDAILSLGTKMFQILPNHMQGYLQYSLSAGSNCLEGTGLSQSETCLKRLQNRPTL